MNMNEFKRLYTESRNGANYLERHGMFRKLAYSDGVKELAECGCWWLLDIVGTECVRVMRGADAMGILKVVVADNKAQLSLELSDDAPPAWTRAIEYTDMPDGEWVFYITSDMSGECTMILPTEY